MQDTQTGALVTGKTEEECAAQIPVERRGPVFHVGEVLEVKGGRSRVNSIGKKAIVLQGLPGTHCKEE